MDTNNTLTQNVGIHLISIIQCKDDKSDGMDSFCSLIVSILCACAVCVEHITRVVNIFPRDKIPAVCLKENTFAEKHPTNTCTQSQPHKYNFFFCKLFSDAVVLCGTDNNIRA